MDDQLNGQRSAAALILLGVFGQIVGLIVALVSWWSNNSNGFDQHSKPGLVVGGIVGWIGFVAMMVGLVAVGVNVALGRRLAPMPLPPPGLTPPTRLVTGFDPDGVAAEADPFGVHTADSAGVAEVRRACEMGASEAALRRLVDQIERTRGFSGEERAMVDALFRERLMRR